MENNYFSQRRTVRSYSDKPISEETLKSIIEQAMRAPTTGNMQLYSVVATRDEEMKRPQPILRPFPFGRYSRIYRLHRQG